MADAGTKATDDIIDELEKQLHKEYTRAAKETTAKLDDYLRRFQIKDEIKRKALQEGKITKEYYQYWRTGQILIGERWKEMANTLATDLANVDAIARSTVKGYMMDVYALNHGYATFEIERDTLLDTSYTLYNRDTVQNLWKNNPKLLPDPVPGSPTAKMLEEHEDMRWNRDHLQAELVQGILQGESIPQLAARMQNVTDMDERSAVRNARTMCTGAMNKGRLDGYQRAKDMGIEVKKVWSATHDGRTRKSHAAQDGEAVDLDKEFPNGCMYPGDPDADPSEVYNCFVGETIVGANTEVIRTYKHEYNGELLTIKTASGVQFTCTPNHPVLTSFGWVPAKRIEKGDDLFVTRVRNGSIFVSFRNPNVNHVLARFDTLHKFCKVFGRKRTTNLGVNFHGDIPTSDVEIVTQKRFLRSNRNSSGGNSIYKFLLIFSDKTFSRIRTLLEHLRSIWETTFSDICIKGKPLSFLRRSLRHTEVHGLRPIALLNSGRVQNSYNGGSRYAELLGKSLNGFTGIVFADKVVSIDVKFSHCDVFNLESKNGYYFAKSIIPHNREKTNNGIMIIAHNCRCSMNCESQRSKHSYYMQELWASLKKGEDIVPYKEWVEKKEQQAKIIGYEGQKTLLEKITAIKADAEKNGYTMERYKQAGAEIRKEYEAEAARLKAQYGEGYDKLKEQYKELQQAEDKAYDAWTQARRERKSPEKIQELKGQWSDILDQRVQTGNKVVEIEANMLLKEEKAADWLAGKLGEVREVGTKDLDMARHFINKRSPVKKDIQYAYEHYPTDWVKDSLQQGALYCGKVGRGYYDGYGIYISGFSEKDFRETAFHELGHRYEDVVSGIKSIETTFFNSRKGDETPTWLGSGYRYDEVAVKDNFIDHYMGKRYSDNSYELVSMGFQYAYWNPERLAQDQEFQELIYGILAIR